MPQHLSPKSLAAMIGVSESSLKRWVDEGRIAAARTEGGHRRIEAWEAIRFIRETAAAIDAPHEFGIAGLTGSAVELVRNGGSDQALLEALATGDHVQATGLLLAEFLQSRSLGAVCDGPIAFARNRLAERQSPGTTTNENSPCQRADRIIAMAIEEIRNLLPPPAADAPRALGLRRGDESEPLLPSMAAAVLRECGFTDSLMPIDPLRTGAAAAPPDADSGLVWMCVSMNEDPAASGPILQHLSERALNGTHVALCGPGASRLGFANAGLMCAESLCELQSIARAMRAAKRRSVQPADPKSRLKASRAG